MVDIRLFTLLMEGLTPAIAVFCGLIIGSGTFLLSKLVASISWFHSERTQTFYFDMVGKTEAQEVGAEFDDLMRGVVGVRKKHNYEQRDAVRRWLSEEVLADEGLEVG